MTKKETGGTSSSICENGPSLKHVAFLTCSSRVGKTRTSDLDSWQAKLFGEGQQSIQQSKGTDMYAYVGVNVTSRICPSMHSPKFPWIIRISAVMVVGMNKGVDNTHNHNSMLKASQKGLSGVVVKVVSSRADCSNPPSSDDEVVEERAFVE